MTSLYEQEVSDIIKKNQNLIYDLASKYDHSLRDDLFQVGAIGMIDAYKHYDPSKNTKFTTYAYLYVDGEMKKFIRENRNIKVSRDIVYLCSKIQVAKEKLSQKLKKEPSLSELSTFLEISEDKIAEALEINGSIKSIDDPINDEGRELTLQDIIYEKENYDKLDLICLREELSKLSNADKEVLNKRYFEDRTQCETAALLGMSQVDVSRTESRLIKMLRNKLG